MPAPLSEAREIADEIAQISRCSVTVGRVGIVSVCWAARSAADSAIPIVDAGADLDRVSISDPKARYVGAQRHDAGRVVDAGHRRPLRDGIGLPVFGRRAVRGYRYG